MERLREGKIYSGTVEGYTSEGQGVVRLDGAVVFVPRDRPGGGDRPADHQGDEDRRRGGAGEAPHSLAGADGAGVPPVRPLWRLPVPAHVLSRRSSGPSASGWRTPCRRLGGSDVPIEGILGAKDPLHYRNKSQYPVGADGSIGFYQAPEP